MTSIIMQGHLFGVRATVEIPPEASSRHKVQEEIFTIPKFEQFMLTIFERNQI
jgi:hypothetical protein